MFRPIAGIRASLSILAILLATSPAQAQSINSQRVQKAIDHAVRFLLSNQLPDGGWKEFDNAYPHGVSSLVVLSLLNSGLPPNHPDVARGLQYLSGRELKKTYTVSLQTMALCAANPNRYADLIRRNARWLIEAQLPDGSWTYGADTGGGGDPSNSQFALLALHEAQRAGVKFPQRTWRIVFGKAKAYWENAQNRDGSFPYNSGEAGRGSMTCAGVASLVIVGAQLDGLESSGGEIIRCCGADLSNQDRIEAGLAWLARNFQVSMNPGYHHYHLYYIYALERVGRLTGRRHIGQYDWYRQGAEHLANSMQEPITGKIVAKTTTYQGNEFSETAFALLFLSKGKRQTIISRLKYGRRSNDWNHHSMAVQHLTAHTEQAWKRDLSWQNVDLNQSTVQDLLESPVLFISGTSTPSLTQNQKQVLKEYVEQGGFILAESCQGNGCDGRAFEEYFRKLVVELFDQPLEKISPDHPLWYAESRVVPEDLPKGAWLYGVQTCCRLGVVYAPFSLSCRWELNLPYGVKPDYSAQVQDELSTATKIGINVLTYATGKELKEKLDTVTILEDVKNLVPTDRGVFFLPKLRHNAGADDAPHAMSNLIQWLDRTNPFRLSDERRMIGITDDELEPYPLVFMHGRGKLELSEVQRDALRNSLRNGGFIFADAICADAQFVESFRREMQLILGEPLTNLEAGHPLLTPVYSGFDIRQVRVIDPDQDGDNVIAAQRRITPRLEVGKVDNRLAVIFSPLDLSCALESRHSLQCHGYVREDAARIGINVILFALQQ